jgi:leucyl-tRNA synthetase
MEIDLTQKNAVELASKQDNVQKYIIGKELKKVIYIPGKIINLIY